MHNSVLKTFKEGEQAVVGLRLFQILIDIGKNEFKICGH